MLQIGYHSGVGSLTSRQQAKRNRASPEWATSGRTAKDAPREGRTMRREARRSRTRSSAWDSHKPRPCESDLQRATGDANDESPPLPTINANERCQCCISPDHSCARARGGCRVMNRAQALGGNHWRQHRTGARLIPTVRCDRTQIRPITACDTGARPRGRAPFSSAVEDSLNSP